MTVSAKELFERHMTPDQRRRADMRGKALIAEHATLCDLRKARDLTQARVGELLGITQKNVCHLEKRSDVLISTLRGYIEAMGGSLSLVVEFPDRDPLVLDGLAPDQETAMTSDTNPS